ncbi:uncharacterized protein LOC143249420 isoform X2 [Tachypleus tridentatus]|uniref:uncharacterized protein LOC143249420 isoform X2 n=1 Tax=Tachypleus tridentatus TaxID=6853 RepID=UPI003FD3D72F
MVQVDIMSTIALLSLAVCVCSRAAHQNGRNNRRHKYSRDRHWDRSLEKRGPQAHSLAESNECCPSITEIIQPRGGVSKSGRILELYRDQNSTQSFYQTSCHDLIKGRPCRYISSYMRLQSKCVQRYSFTYALVREFNSKIPWRLDYIRIRNGCTCEIRRSRKRDVDT